MRTLILLFAAALAYGANAVTPTACTITMYKGGPVRDSCLITVTGDEAWTATNGTDLAWHAFSGAAPGGEPGTVNVLKSAWANVNLSVGDHSPMTQPVISGQEITVTIRIVAKPPDQIFSNDLGVADSELADCSNPNSAVYNFAAECDEPGTAGYQDLPEIGETWTSIFGTPVRHVAEKGLRYIGLRAISSDNARVLADFRVFDRTTGAEIADNVRDAISSLYVDGHAFPGDPDKWVWLSPYSSPSIFAASVDGMGSWTDHGAIWTNPHGSPPGNGVNHGGSGGPTANGFIAVLACDLSYLFVVNLNNGEHAEFDLSTLGADTLLPGSTAGAPCGDGETPDHVMMAGPDAAGKYHIVITIDYDDDNISASRHFEFDGDETITYSGLGPQYPMYYGYANNNVNRGVAGGNLTNIICASNLCTATTTVAHNRTKNDLIRVESASDGDLNGGKIIWDVPTSTTFRFHTANVTDATYSGGGLQIAYVPTNAAVVTTQNAKTYGQAFPVGGNHNCMVTIGGKNFVGIPWERDGTVTDYALFFALMGLSNGIENASAPRENGGGWMLSDQVGSHHACANAAPYTVGTAAGGIVAYPITDVSGSEPATITVPGYTDEGGNVRAAPNWETGTHILVNCIPGATIGIGLNSDFMVTALGSNQYEIPAEVEGIVTAGECAATLYAPASSGAQIQVNRYDLEWGVFQSKRIAESRAVNFGFGSYDSNPFGDISSDGTEVCWNSNFAIPKGVIRLMCAPTGLGAVNSNCLSLDTRCITTNYASGTLTLTAVANSTEDLEITLYDSNFEEVDSITCSGDAYPAERACTPFTGLMEGEHYHWRAISADFKDVAVWNFDANTVVSPSVLGGGRTLGGGRRR